MKGSFLKINTLFILCIIFYACKNNPSSSEEQRMQDSLSLAKKGAVMLNDLEGSLGIIDVPEMISLCILDSASEQEVPSRMSHDFNTLDSDRVQIGAEVNGPPGLIYYNNDPKNFKFECLQLIRSIPAVVPKHSKIVTLEADRMLVYNYYGPYGTTFKAYEEIKRLCQANQLIQSGPMREFYPAVTLKTDTSKKLTRIMVPVRTRENTASQ